MRIGLTTIYVDDQDRAERFYTEVLGFQVKTSAPYGPSERWLSLVSPEAPDGVELALHLADEHARAFQDANCRIGRPALTLRTDDCQGEAERLRAKGVVFVKEPTTMPYGGIDAVFSDTCGNLLDLHQDSPHDTHHPDDAPTPGPEIQRLGALVGRWRSEGRVVGEVPVPITGTDIYEWLPGGFFLVHHVDVVVGKQPVRATEILGEYDPTTDSFTGRAYDNQGNITIMRATVDAHGVWTFTGGGDVAAAARPSAADATGAVRSTLTVSPDRSSMTARWERGDDGSTWQPWMDMTFTRMS